MYPIFSERINNMMKRWKAIEELQKEGVVSKGNPNFSYMVTQKCNKLQRTDNVNDLAEVISILNENDFSYNNSKKNNL